MKKDLISDEEMEKIQQLLDRHEIIENSGADDLLESTLEIDDITGRLIIISTRTLSDNYKKAKWQIWRATGGFGCKAGNGGSAVFAQCIEDGENARWRINQVLGVIK